ncbi:MAG TPA: RlmE family RNA methyltransferase [Myxococcota bacterium]|nr:RlmE family RNA methyltransferase [Myxococcota bacterium]
MSRFITKDHYFIKAKSQGFKARSVFKLSEIDESLKLFKKDSKVLDLGCAPGSWLQYVASKIGPKGLALGVDLTPVTESFHPSIKTVVDDCFLLDHTKIAMHLGQETRFDVVLSDMAPKTTGIKHVDQIRSFDLAETALNIAEPVLKKGGHVVIKVFAGAEVSLLIARMKRLFSVVKQMRPKSVRAPSKEFYVVGLNKK